MERPLALRVRKDRALYAVIAYLIVSYVALIALVLWLVKITGVYTPGRRRTRWLDTGLRVFSGLVVLFAISFLLCITTTMPRNWLWLFYLPGGILRVFLGHMLGSTAHPSILTILTGCLLVTALSVVGLSMTKTRADTAARRIRVLAVCALMLLPWTPYGIVEAQTLVFRNTFNALIHKYQSSLTQGAGKWKVLSIDSDSAVVGVPCFTGDVLFLQRSHNEWRIEKVTSVRGEYPGVFPPYPGLVF